MAIPKRFDPSPTDEKIGKRVVPRDG